ncbi:methyltransferase domain-containing protein [Streptomyces mesophilus]|uniref:methyltransferase domain-containing protein n=1 Tax=Streptomyces mesophilus TaxID=1775132 RepID=UPI003330F513
MSTDPVNTAPHSERSFDELVREAEEADVSGWDFSWFEGRATELRPSWGYQRLLSERLGAAGATLDLQTGGGEVLAGALRMAARAPGVSAATEAYPPNVLKATRLLHPLGTTVVAAPDEPPFPIADGAFDLVTSRHPVKAHFAEIARVLAPGGTYFAQHVGPASVFELVEYFLGPQPEEVRRGRHPDDERAEAEAAGLHVLDLRLERLRMEFHDIGAVVHFLRKVIWMVPGFTVAAYLPQLRALDAQIRSEGPFVAHSTRFLIEARKGRD